jgi:hypothetical protein
MSLFAAHHTEARLLRANDESLIFLVPTKSSTLNAVLPKLFELCVQDS